MLPTDPTRVWPYWIERQIDPTGPDFMPCEGVPSNATHRSATMLGNVASSERALVDPRGLLTPDSGCFSVDWWIGAEDRWHLPSRSKTVRQRLLRQAPVVETAMRVPGGDVLHRAFTIHSAGIGACAVIEIENRTSVPVAVGFAVRPYDLLGTTALGSIELRGATVVIDGVPAMAFPRSPARVLFGDTERGDVANALFAATAAATAAGAEPEPEPAGVSPVLAVHDDRGGASAVFVFPLAHTSILRVLVPLAVAGAPARRVRLASVARRGRGAVPAAVDYPATVPGGDQVASGWRSQVGRGVHIEVPDDRLQQAIDAAIAHLLLAHGGRDLVGWPTPLDLPEMAVVLRALDRFGFHDEVAQVLARWPDHQSLDGSFAGSSGRNDANAAALDAVAEHWLLTGEATFAEGLVGPLAKAAHWIEKRRANRRLSREPRTTGLVSAGAARPGCGPAGTFWRDTAVSSRALGRIAGLFDVLDQPGVAADCRAFAASMAADLDVNLRAQPAGEPLAATADRRFDVSAVANLDVALPFGVLAADDKQVIATLEGIRTHLTADDAVRHGLLGFSPQLTAQLAEIEIELGDRRALDRLTWLIDAAGTVMSWPTVIHPRTGGGAAGRPHDPVATASFLSLVRNLLVRELPEGRGLALCSLVPPDWRGQSIDVRNAPCAFGRLSFAVRWHGDRPALLWELEPHGDAPPSGLTISAPGLDPSWSTTEVRGEALLAAVVAPAPSAVDVEAVDQTTDSPPAVPTWSPVVESPVTLRPPTTGNSSPAVPRETPGSPNPVGDSFS